MMMKASVRRFISAVSLMVMGLFGTVMIGCSSGNVPAPSGPPVYVLSVASIANLHENITTVSPADIEGVTAGTTNLSLSYKPGATVTLTAAAMDINGNGAFLGWCDASSANTSPFKCIAPACTSTTGLTCTVTMNSNLNLLATYPGVTNITVNPQNARISVPSSAQFTATVDGLGTYVDSTGMHNYQGSLVRWTVSPPLNYIGSPGTIDPDSGLYTVSAPAPPTATIRATSKVFPTVYGATPVTLQ
jgi:hypothetical protein